MEKIAVIGAGLMGHGIAQVFAVKGHEVAIHDPFPEVLARVPERVCANLRSLGLDESSVERISLHGTLKAAVERADIVFEAAPENLALKQDIFARLSTSTPPAVSWPAIPRSFQLEKSQPNPRTRAASSARIGGILRI